MHREWPVHQGLDSWTPGGHSMRLVCKPLKGHPLWALSNGCRLCSCGLAGTSWGTELA